MHASREETVQTVRVSAIIIQSKYIWLLNQNIINSTTEIIEFKLISNAGSSKVKGWESLAAYLIGISY